MKGKINLRTILLVVLAVLVTSFAFMNYFPRVPVWPLPGYYPLTLVIAIAFGLGVGIGILGHSLLGLFTSQEGRQLEGVQTIRAGEREHPGRP